MPFFFFCLSPCIITSTHHNLQPVRNFAYFVEEIPYRRSSRVHLLILGFVSLNNRDPVRWPLCNSSTYFAQTFTQCHTSRSVTFIYIFSAFNFVRLLTSVLLARQLSLRQSSRCQISPPSGFIRGAIARSLWVNMALTFLSVLRFFCSVCLPEQTVACSSQGALTDLFKKPRPLLVSAHKKKGKCEIVQNLSTLISKVGGRGRCSLLSKDHYREGLTEVLSVWPFIPTRVEGIPHRGLKTQF